MSKCAAVFLCMTFGLATAGAANVPVPAAKTAGPVATPAVSTGVKATKSEVRTARGHSAVTARETFANPYETPLLLNARPLAIGRP